jgi:hypothetical protein
MCAFLCVKDFKWCTVALLGSALLGSTPKVREITSEDGTQTFEMHLQQAQHLYTHLIFNDFHEPYTQ